MRFASFLILLGVLLAPIRGFASTAGSDAEATVVIYNSNDPESKDLADFYCTARGIDPSHQIALATSSSEEISREEFERTIEKPLIETFAKRGYWRFTRTISGQIHLARTLIGYAAIIRGIPLKIAQDNSRVPAPQSSPTAPTGKLPVTFANGNPYPRMMTNSPRVSERCNAASVDSELSLLGFWHHPINGPLGNPYCVSIPGKSPEAPPILLFIGRLDAPTAAEVKRMIQEGLKVEKEGLWGWGVTDTRSIDSANYKMGDDWIRDAARAMRCNGIPVIGDDLPGTIPEGFPLPEVSAYYGWYSGGIDGPFADPAFRFVPGAVAFHLHSFSASSLRNAQGWTTPLLLHGAAASLGNVYEPYLGLTTDFGTMAWILLTGHNLAQSYYAAQPSLSWMSVLVGDPLYRPYAALTESSLPETKWSDYRHIILDHGGSVLKAAPELKQRARERHESLYLEALGAAEYDAGQWREAAGSFHEAATLTVDSGTAFRLLLEQSRALEKLGNRVQAANLLTDELYRLHTPQEKKLLIDWLHRIDPDKAP